MTRLNRPRSNVMEALTFEPIYQARVWGGRRLESRFGRTLPEPQQPFGESWEISGRPEAASRVARGTFAGRTINELWQGDSREAIFGANAPFDQSETFPILCKILDARERLSLQVHPPAEVAEQLGGEPKSEMWFVADAEPGAELFVGLKAGVDREAFAEALESGTAEDLVHRISVSAGDFIHIPSGRLHAIGAGIVIYEIQQNSDTTYRVFDWNRIGLDGKPRDLHLAESLQCIDFGDVEPGLDSPNGALLCECEHFRIERHRLDSEREFPNGQFAIITVISGEISLGETEFTEGDFFLLPANSKPGDGLHCFGAADFLLTTFPS